MLINPEELDKFLCNFREKLNDPDYIANPFFYLVKPTEENMEKYRLHHSKYRISLFLELALVFPRIIKNFITSLVIAALKSHESRMWGTNQFSPTQNLIISHYTYAQNPKMNDVFFDNAALDPRNFVLYLNSTRTDAQVIQRNYNQSSKENLVINTKSLNLFQTLKLQLKQLSLSTRLLNHVLRDNNLSLIEKRLIVTAAHFQHSRPTIANLVLKVRLCELLKALQPRTIILTIEGHAHENMILQLRDSDFKQIRLVGFQHAPIVPGQFGFYHVLESFKMDDLLLTCGETTEILIKHALPNLRVDVLGSPKFTRTENYSKAADKVHVLGAVEGTVESLKSFIQLFNSISKQLPQLNFALRLHPAIDRNLSKKQLRSMSESENLKLSYNSLEEDLKRSHAVIFRSSAVGIHGLGYSALPVHFDSCNKGMLNPLSGTVFGNLEFDDESNLAKFLEKLNLQDLQSNEFYDKCSNVLEKYYAPLKDLNTLID